MSIFFRPHLIPSGADPLRSIDPGTKRVLEKARYIIITVHYNKGMEGRQGFFCPERDCSVSGAMGSPAVTEALTQNRIFSGFQIGVANQPATPGKGRLRLVHKTQTGPNRLRIVRFTPKTILGRVCPSPPSRWREERGTIRSSSFIPGQ